MSFRTIAAIVLLAAFAGLAVLLALSRREGPEPPPQAVSSSADCRRCHPEVFAEWQESWHALAWFDPLVRAPNMSDNFKKKDCIPCHAPRPLFEIGLGEGQRVVERQSNRQDGVDCLACHKLPSGGVAAARRDPRGDCNPKFREELASPQICYPCHNQHGTVDEWLAAPAALRTASCNPCHFPPVARPGRDGGPSGEGRSHLLRTWRSHNLDMEALTVKPELALAPEGRLLRVRVINDKTPHNVPTDSRHRALDLVVTFYSPGGAPFPPAGAEPREFGQEDGTWRLRFRNPYRSDIGEENTQIVSGTEAVLEAPVPEGAASASIRLLYKLTPFTTDAEAIQVFAREIEL